MIRKLIISGAVLAVLIYGKETRAADTDGFVLSLAQGSADQVEGVMPSSINSPDVSIAIMARPATPVRLVVEK